MKPGKQKRIKGLPSPLVPRPFRVMYIIWSLGLGGAEQVVIRTARGLPQDVVRSTKVRIGEGISGVAAAERVPLRLNAATTPPRLLGALRHPELQDAMVVPVVRGSQLLGVLCVSTTRPEGLRDDGLSLLQRLTGLAEATLP